MEKLRDFWVRVALAVAIALPFYFLAAALSARLGLFDWRFALENLTLHWGRLLALGALAFATVGVVMAFFVAPPRGRRLAVFALFVPAAALGITFYDERAAAIAAPIHDVSTDLMDPPRFSEAVRTARDHAYQGNGLDLLTKHTADGHAFTDLQRRYYPDITSIPTGLAPARAFEMALALARAQHWNVTMADPATGSIEAKTETLWFGFIDDIAVRVRPDGAGARIDMRSVSRERATDGGANAARMRVYLTELRRQIQEAESH